jgi:hypothetical protein
VADAWHDLEALAFKTGRMTVPTHNDYAKCILELRARVELLEATQHAHTEANSKPTPNPRQIRSSLVERVALAISGIEDSSCWDDEAVNWAPEARAAIREVAAWLDENTGGDAAWMLTQETGR